ncbi:MAG: DUF3365 domain-containing protein, partial [Verrucomicrobiales bacterium]|nr:DUF3365 domain-containing protein [Verrucomicrobiales bacterium]
VRATLQTAPRPLLLHCGSSNRAGAVWLAARALDQGVELEKAVEDAKLVGLKKEAYEEKARAYIATRRKAESSLSDQQKEDIRKLGSEAAASLMKQLSGQLKAAMSAGGPVAAVGVCKSVALPITKAAGDEMKGVEIGRTSLKTRNPQNQPDAVDRTVLEKWLTETPGEEIISIHENAVRYYKPVVVQAVCLQCHGGMDAMDEKLVQLLSQTYPGDQATGYKEGDLRGAIRVKIDLKQALQQ